MHEQIQAAFGILQDAVSKYRAEKIAATQRGASPEELAAIEDRMHDAIWLLQQMETILKKENDK